MQPLFVARSDGVLQTKNPKTGKMESNGPSEDQMENSKDSSGNPDTYREVGIGDPKNLEWRRKLGGLLVTELLKMGPEKDHKAMSLLSPHSLTRIYTDLRV